MIGGRTLAAVGDQVVAAERAYGSGSVTLIGFDPTVDWIAKTDTSGSLWRRLLPARTSGGLTFSDDSMLVNAVSQLPTLALPPITGLLALLIAYIVLIGPINYLVLKRLDRREWAWITMPILIVVFAAGAYAYGALLRGSDVIVNEIAIVRGAPGATEGSAQAYLGVFSPSRSVYQVSVPGGALLSTSINGDMFGGVGTATVLDVLQGDPARVRDLAVGFRVVADDPGRDTGGRPAHRGRPPSRGRPAEGHGQECVRAGAGATRRSSSARRSPSSTISSRAPRRRWTSPCSPGSSTQSLSDKVVGQMLGNEGAMTPDVARTYVRHYMVDQLSYDPNMGPTNMLSADGPVVLAWGSNELLPVEIAGQKPRHLGNVLYYLPARLAISGKTTFRADMLRSTVVESDAVVFNRDATTLNFGRGSVTLAYRPVGFEGRITPSRLTIGLNFGENGPVCLPGARSSRSHRSRRPASPRRPIRASPLSSTISPISSCSTSSRAPGSGLPRFESGTQYAVDSPARYVDPSSGTVLIRFVNDVTDGVGFSIDVSISGDIE